jgi:hypothetical protein
LTNKLGQAKRVPEFKVGSVNLHQQAQEGIAARNEIKFLSDNESKQMRNANSMMNLTLDANEF